jgi:uncharacterized membrane protein
VDLKAPGYNLLGDHFHPILMLLAPVYRLFPTAETLLIAQAALIAVSAITVGRAAQCVLGPRLAIAVTVAYGLSWGLQEVVAADFHEVSFAVPMLALSLGALGQQRWRAAAAWAAPLVLVKEDMPATVAVIGVLLIFRGRHRLGAGTVLGASLAAALVFAILPTFNPGYPAYYYADQIGQSSHGWGLEPKLHTLVLLGFPVLFMAMRSPLLLVALPTLGWRFLADNPLYWGDTFHYSAVLMPIVFFAFLDTLSHPLAHHPIAQRRFRAAVVLASLAVNFALAPNRPLWRMTDPAFWQVPPPVVATIDALRVIPDEATVAATNGLAAQLTGRCRVRLLDNSTPEQETAEWIAADLSRDSFLTAAKLREHVNALRALGYQPIEMPADVPIVVMRRAA